MVTTDKKYTSENMETMCTKLQERGVKIQSSHPWGKVLAKLLDTLRDVVNLLVEKYDDWEHGLYKDRYDGTFIGIQFEISCNYIFLTESIDILNKVGVIEYVTPIEDPFTFFQDHKINHKGFVTYILFHEEVLEEWIR